MDAWRNHMPEGMLLKSDGFASNLYDPQGEYPLSRYCRELGIAYDDKRIRVRLDTFIDYGLAFARRFVPELTTALVQSLRRDGNGFALRLDDGSLIMARRVVVAVGVERFKHVPEKLRASRRTGVAQLRPSRSLDLRRSPDRGGRRRRVGDRHHGTDAGPRGRRRTDLPRRPARFRQSSEVQTIRPSGTAFAIRVRASAQAGHHGSAPTRRSYFILDPRRCAS